jgi:micrococcal nuclease
MRQKHFIISALTLLLFLSPCLAKQNEYVVTRILDGDTVILDTGETVRYIGIDAPELGKKNGGPGFYAREASRFNKGLVLLKKVRLEFDKEKKDSYGRFLAYVYVKNTLVNSELVRQGYARVMTVPPNTKYKDLFVKNQKEAISKELGIWQEKKKETEAYYVGNKRSYVFHKPSCPLADKMSDKSRIVFRNRTDPIAIGYSPCRKCKP